MAGRNRDAHLRLSVSDDAMRASASLEPALGEGHGLDRSQCEAILQAEGIVHGIEWEALEQALARTAAGESVPELTVAGGTPAEDADPAYLKLAARFFTVQLYGRERGGRVDFREARPFIVVSSGEALGRFSPAAPGIPGRDVYGREVAPGEKRRIPFVPGEGTRRDGELLRADRTGRISLDGNRVTVQEILELPGVDFSTGNIRYPGDVVLRGEVSDGFSIVCGGDLHAAVPLDVTDIQIKGDLTAEGGVLGRRPGILKVGGCMEARFLENLDLECRGTVRIAGSVLHSRVHTLERLICGEKGRIINSRIYAVAGVEAQQLGNSAGQLTLISCGSDFRVLRRISELRQRRRRLKLKLETLRGLQSRGGFSPAGETRLAELARRTGAEIEELEEAAREALSGVERAPGATIHARDTVYPGVTLEICQVTRRVTSSIPRGLFYLDDSAREIELRDS